MDLSQRQQNIDAITWYHDFDFGNGLRARSTGADNWGHRRLWQFLERQLDQIDFRGKSVLDIGCWDGYWSFYAERRGAESVLATDDQTQNWAGSQGFHVARELLHSSVKANLNTSVYELADLGEKFDVILFLGVYYHLFDPFYAFAQIRHCCHRDTLIVIDGPVATGMPPGTGRFNFANHACEFCPTLEALQQIERAAYFTEVERVLFDDVPPPPGPGPKDRLGWRWRLGMCRDVLSGSRGRIKDMIGRIEGPPMPSHQRLFSTCVPFAGQNELHAYKPPFGLHQYDDRFCEAQHGTPRRPFLADECAT